MGDNFYTNVIQKDDRYNSTKTITDPMLLEPGTWTAVQLIMALAKQQGYDLRIGETYRSQARQLRVFKAGASKFKKVGCHGYGLAADLQLFEDGKYVSNGSWYNFLVPLSRKVGLISGIDWGHLHPEGHFVDAGHVQRIPIFRQDSVFNGTWYPPVIYDPFADMAANGVK